MRADRSKPAPRSPYNSHVSPRGIYNSNIARLANDHGPRGQKAVVLPRNVSYSTLRQTWQSFWDDSDEDTHHDLNHRHVHTDSPANGSSCEMSPKAQQQQQQADQHTTTGSGLCENSTYDTEDEAAPPSFIDQEKEREEARKLLEQAEQRKKKAIDQIAKSRAEMYHHHRNEEADKDARQKEIQRIIKLRELERERELVLKEQLKQLEKYSNEVLETRVKLLRKIVEINAKDSLQRINMQYTTTAKVTPVETISVSEIQQKARARQRRLIEERAKIGRELMKNTLIGSFEELTQMPADMDKKDVEKKLEESLKSEIERRRQAKMSSLSQTMEHVQRTREQMIYQKKEEIRRMIREKLEEKHKQKCDELFVAKNSVGLTDEEVAQLLSLPLKHYETDIGIADAEMKELKQKILETEEKMQQVIEETEKRVCQLENNRGTLRLELVGREGEIEHLTRELKQLIESRKCIGRDQDSKGKGVEELTEELEEHNSKQQALAAEIAELKQVVANNMAQVAQLHAQLEQHHADYAELRKTSTVLQEKVKRFISNQNDNLEHNAVFAALEASIAEAREGIAKEKDKIHSIKKQADARLSRLIGEMLLYEHIKNRFEQQGNDIQEYHKVTVEREIREEISRRRERIAQLNAELEEKRKKETELVTELVDLKAARTSKISSKLINKKTEISLEEVAEELAEQEALWEQKEQESIKRLGDIRGKINLNEMRCERFTASLALRRWREEECTKDLATVMVEAEEPLANLPVEKQIERARQDLCAILYREKRLQALVENMRRMAAERGIEVHQQQQQQLLLLLLQNEETVVVVS